MWCGVGCGEGGMDGLGLQMPLEWAVKRVGSGQMWAWDG